MKIAVVGATGMVGQIMLKVLEERNFPVKEITQWLRRNLSEKKLVLKAKNIR